MMNTPYVYAITDFVYIKIGVAQRPSKRRNTLATGNAKKLVILGYFPGGYELETELHNRFKKVRENGEWFVPTPDLIEYLNEQIFDKYIVVENGVIRSYLKMLN